jgi:uncharacterized protein DUF998
MPPRLRWCNYPTLLWSMLHSAAVAVPLALFAVARLVISWSPMDAHDAPGTRTGRRHLLLAIIAFAAITIAALMLPPTLDRTGRWADLVTLLRATGWFIALVLTGTSLRLPALQPYFGAVERVLYVVMLGWLALVGYADQALSIQVT